ncbi:MAG: tail fiber domain-containing protein [bacterium]
MSPRTEVTSVAYAYRSVKTDSADYADMVDGFNASVTPTAGDLFPLSYGDAQYVNEGQADAIDNPMIVDGTVLKADVDAAFKAPFSDTAPGMYSFAAGRQVRITGTANYTFAFGRDFATSTTDAVVFHNSSSLINVGIGNTAPTHLLDVGTNGAYCDGFAWINGCSREYKERVVELSPEEALETVNRLTPVKYNYKSNKDETFVGFIAEDVPELVAMNDRKGLSPMDIVATLTRVVQNQQKEIETLRKEIDALKRVN